MRQRWSRTMMPQIPGYVLLLDSRGPFIRSVQNIANRYCTECIIGIVQKCIILKSPSFCSRSQAENPHICCVLPLSDEFRERIALCGSHEKFGKCLAERVCDDKFGGRDSGTNGSQPGAEGVPNQLWSSHSEILEQPLGDNAGLDEGMICAHFAFDTVSVIVRLAMKILIAIAGAQRNHVLHPEMVGE